MKHFIVAAILLILIGSISAPAQSGEGRGSGLAQGTQMTSWSRSDMIASVSAGAAVLSVIVSLFAVFVAGKARSTNKKMFKRQGVIDLHMAWHGVNEIDNKNPITSNVVRAVGALDLTAALWNHDVIEKEILYQSYWFPFKQLYDALVQCDAVPLGTSRRCKDLITNPISRAYEDMKKFELKKVGTSKV